MLRAGGMQFADSRSASRYGRFTSLSLLLANIVTSWRSDTRKASSRLLNLRVSRDHRVRCTPVLGICLVAAEPHSSYDQSMWSWHRSGLHLGTYWISSHPHLSSISPCTSGVQLFCDECDENDDGSPPIQQSGVALGVSTVGTRYALNHTILPKKAQHHEDEAMHDTSRRNGLCSWLFKAGVLIAWHRHRHTSRKTVMTVNDTWLRALGRVTNSHRATVACRVRE